MCWGSVGWGCGAHGAEEASGSLSGREAAPCCALGQLCSGAGAVMPLRKHWRFSVKVERGLESDTQATDFVAWASSPRVTAYSWLVKDSSL